MWGRFLSTRVLAQWLLGCLLLAIAVGCDESLPPRATPTDVLQATLWVADQTFIYHPHGAAIQPVSIHVYLKNLYDEVLQDTFRVRGAVDILDRKRPGLTWELNLQAAKPGSGGVFPVDEVLTLKPSEQVDLAQAWPHTLVDRSGAKQFAWDGLPMTLHHDQWNAPYLVSDTLFLAAHATAKIFPNAASVRTEEQSFRLVYWIYVDTIGTQ